jgi:hypothetical protein
MREIYYDLAGPGSLGGIGALSKYSKVKDLRKVAGWLTRQDAYTLHKPIRRKFPRRKTFVPGINHLYQIDLVDVSSIARFNDRNNFILTCIDCFSRYAFAIPIRNKSALEVKDGFASILESNDVIPAYVQSDKGREFVNAIFQSYLKQRDILFYTSENDDIKCAIVERFNRTLKSKMWRYFTYSKTYRYVDVLNDLVTAYNRTYHRSIKMAPEEVGVHNERQVFVTLYGKTVNTATKKAKFKIGDKVRLSKTMTAFDKSYLPRWTRELFLVKSVLPTHPPTYELTDYAGEEVKGRFYGKEIQKVEKEVFEIEKIIKTKVANGKIQYFVKWLGYPDKFNSWIDSIN